MNTRTTAAVAGVAMMLLAACGGDQSPRALPPIPTAPPTTTTSVAPAETATTLEEEQPADTVTTTVPVEDVFDPTSSIDVLATFGIPPADLVTDPDSPNNNRTISVEDEPIIAAYLASAGAQMTASSEWPLDAEHPALMAGPFTPEVLGRFNIGVDNRTALNHVLDISDGLTSRPYVIEDDDGDPDRAIVWDCQIDATFWKDVDTGEKAPPGGGYPNVGSPGAEVGAATVLLLRDGEWLADSGAAEPRACS